MTDGREFTAADFLSQLQALLPPGVAWTRIADALITKLLSGFAPELARVQAADDQLLIELNPATAIDLLDVHEFVNGLPDPCADPPTDTTDRQNVLLARLRDKAGHNNADYEALAVTLGHVETTVHSRPYLPFRAGLSRAGDRCYGDAWAFLYAVEYMENLLSGTWATASASIAAGAIAANGSDDAETVTFGAGGYIFQSILGAPPSAQTDIWMRVASGVSTPVVLETRNTFGATLATLSTAVSNIWRRYSLRSSDEEQGVSEMRLSSAGAQDIMIWRPLAGMVDDILECRFSKVGQAHTVPAFHVVGDYFPNG